MTSTDAPAPPDVSHDLFGELPVIRTPAFYSNSVDVSEVGSALLARFVTVADWAGQPIVSALLQAELTPAALAAFQDSLSSSFVREVHQLAYAAGEMRAFPEAAGNPPKISVVPAHLIRCALVEDRATIEMFTVVPDVKADQTRIVPVVRVDTTIPVLRVFIQQCGFREVARRNKRDGGGS